MADIGAVPLSRDIGALQSTEVAATINPEFIPRGLGPDADIGHLILRGMNVNPAVGGNGWLNRNYFWDNV